MRCYTYECTVHDFVISYDFTKTNAFFNWNQISYNITKSYLEVISPRHLKHILQCIFKLCQISISLKNREITFEILDEIYKKRKKMSIHSLQLADIFYIISLERCFGGNFFLVVVGRLAMEIGGYTYLIVSWQMSGICTISLWGDGQIANLNLISSSHVMDVLHGKGIVFDNYKFQFPN